jgi:hypothetical protein
MIVGLLMNHHCVLLLYYPRLDHMVVMSAREKGMHKTKMIDQSKGGEEIATKYKQSQYLLARFLLLAACS